MSDEEIVHALDVQAQLNLWLSLGFHLDHTNPSLTLHLPGVVVSLGWVYQPGAPHSLRRLFDDDLPEYEPLKPMEEQAEEIRAQDNEGDKDEAESARDDDRYRHRMP